ncbi:tail spike protein [Proteus phage vB_PmiS_PM-CJR]|nr:tail spike protein [Proteus phage vB_PmiS_PM-CJR]
MSDCKNYVSEEDIKALKESELHIEHVARSRNLAGEKVLSVTDTIRGEKVTNRTLDGLEDLYQDALSNIGYQQMGDFEQGINITGRNQIVFENGSWYIYRGDLPHVTTGASLAEDGGVWSEENPNGQWVNVGQAGIKEELASSNGANMIGYKLPHDLSILRKLSVKIDERVSLLDFGLIGDGIADDSNAIQKALDYCYEKKVGLTGKYGLKSKVTKTIYLPPFEDRFKMVDLDFCGLMLLPTSEVKKVFISGKKSGNDWVSSMEDPIMSQNISNLTVRNLIINNDDVNDSYGRVAFGFKELHINCKTENLISRNFELGFDFNNCFYLHSLNNIVLNSEPLLKTSTGHKYRNGCNLMKIEAAIALNTKDGYVFEAGVTGVVLDKMSFEGQGVSIISKGEIFDMTIQNSYLENVGDDRDICFDFQSYSHVTFSNNYMWAKRAKHLVKHKPLQPRNMIEIQKNNFIYELPVENYFIDKGLHYSEIHLKNTQASPDLSNTLFRMKDMGQGVILHKNAINLDGLGRPTHISTVVNEFIPGNYSGKYDNGYKSESMYGLYDPVKDTVNGSCEFKTKILYSDTQLLKLGIKIADVNNVKEYTGLIWGNKCYKPDGAIDDRVLITSNDEFVVIKITGISKGNFNILGGQARIL